MEHDGSRMGWSNKASQSVGEQSGREHQKWVPSAAELEGVSFRCLAQPAMLQRPEQGLELREQVHHGNLQHAVPQVVAVGLGLQHVKQVPRAAAAVQRAGAAARWGWARWHHGVGTANSGQVGSPWPSFPAPLTWHMHSCQSAAPARWGRGAAAAPPPPPGSRPRPAAAAPCCPRQPASMHEQGKT